MEREGAQPGPGASHTLRHLKTRHSDRSLVPTLQLHITGLVLLLRPAGPPEGEGIVPQAGRLHPGFQELRSLHLINCGLSQRGIVDRFAANMSSLILIFREMPDLPEEK